MREFIKPITILFGSAVLVWLLIYAAIPSGSKLLVFCLLAFALGLRHGLDADHIAAIDNITRKMVADGQSKYTVGIYFALGHSSVVFLMTLMIVIGVLTFKGNQTLADIGAMVGTTVSILFLLITALINAWVFRNVYRNNGGDQAPSGIFVKLFHRIFNYVTRPSYMYFVGFLFGLGFDTATEIAILGMAASQAMDGVAIYYILLLPVAFAVGMCITDALDSWMQLGLCKWSNYSSYSRRRYNLAITAFSVVVAVGIAGVEILGMLNSQAWLSGFFSDNSELIGLAIVVIFGGSWLLVRLFSKSRLAIAKS
ncbi:HoxN/HupN/NixA family nickel/cobalt transporter [Dongshaea marina]|uniref:HoxN/HupN/NixA family nickel/cobalt transporter n=1 Tax=Dongshaea marina TaxID=2047966 RepID=UPI00131F31C6|nr:metal transporter [Dongshaea marina]